MHLATGKKPATALPKCRTMKLVQSERRPVLCYLRRGWASTFTSPTASTNSQIQEIQSPTTCHVEFGTDPYMYVRFLADCKQQLKSKIQVPNVPPGFNSHASTSGGGLHSGHFPVMDGRAVLVPPLTRFGDPGTVNEAVHPKLLGLMRI